MMQLTAEMCGDGRFFKKPNFVCQDCDPQCELCAGTEKYCLKCKDSTNNLFNFLDNTCISSCPL